MEIGNQEKHENFGEPEGKEGRTGQDFQSANCRDLPHSSTVGRSVGGCIWNFDLRVFVSLSPPSQLDEGRTGIQG